VYVCVCVNVCLYVCVETMYLCVCVSVCHTHLSIGHQSPPLLHLLHLLKRIVHPMHTARVERRVTGALNLER
jgi:hypothetical protein